jgi:hypothetical protein
MTFCLGRLLKSEKWAKIHEKFFARDYPYFGKSDTGTPAGGTKGDTSTPIRDLACCLGPSWDPNFPNLTF